MVSSNKLFYLELEEFRNDIIKGLDQSHVLVLGDIKKIGHGTFYRAWEKNFKVDSIKEISNFRMSKTFY